MFGGLLNVRMAINKVVRPFYIKRRYRYYMETFIITANALITAPKKERIGLQRIIKANNEKEAIKKFKRNIFPKECISFTYEKINIEKVN